jgi:hypothetical protein
MKKEKTGALFFLKKYLKDIENFKKNPIETQNNILFSLLKKSKNTEWGKKYNYKAINSSAEFKKKLPINKYEDLYPYIDRLLKGENNLLWPEKIKYFAKSSGTIGSKSKFIPISKSALKECHYKGGKALFASYFNQVKNSKMFVGYNFSLSGSQQNLDLGKGKYIADVSVILIKNLPIWARLRKTPKFKLATLSDWDKKIPSIANVIRKKKITSLSGVPSWTLLLLRKVLKDSGKKNLKEVWPNIELFVHGGINFSPYREQFKELIPDENMHYLEAYNASEGFFAFQDDLKRKDMLLHLNSGVFYEFLPLENLNDKNPKTLGLDEVKLDKNYAIIISTNAGLWRYMIGDTVKFTDLNPHRIVVSGRTKSYINAFGEEVIEDNSNKAINYACKRNKAIIKDYTVAPVYISKDRQGAHQWLIEFEKEPENKQFFMNDLDARLKELNSDYEAKRYKDLSLTFPELIIAKEHLFYNWIKNNNRLSSQTKIPRLCNNRRVMDNLLEMNNN